jgi:hypothetical protein
MLTAIVRAAFGLIFLFYGLLLPWLRHIHFVAFLLTIPSLALWIGTIYLHMPNKIILFFVALAVEIILERIAVVPGYRNLTRGWRLRRDYEHYLDRMTAFFTILLGSGIELLISSSPAKHQVSSILVGIASATKSPHMLIAGNLALCRALLSDILLLIPCVSGQLSRLMVPGSLSTSRYTNGAGDQVFLHAVKRSWHVEAIWDM